MSNRTLNLDDRIYRYLLDHGLREDETLSRLREVTAQLEQGVMQISPEQGQFMTLLVELIGAERIIEVGTFTGYSALCMAKGMPSHGELICCDVSDEWTGIGRPFWREAGVEDRIRLVIGPALDTLDALVAEGQSGGFDMAFIDADKTNYLAYYERCLTLLRPGGLLAIDNTLWGGAVADADLQDPDTESLRELNNRLHRDERVTMSLLPIGDGLTLARKRS